MTTAIDKAPTAPLCEGPDTESAPADEADHGQSSAAQPDPHMTGAEDPGAEDETRGRKSKLTAIQWGRVITYGLLPGIALLLAMLLGYLKWVDTSARDAVTARAQSIAVAADSTIALLSYGPDSVEKELTAAQGRLTGSFRDAYAALIHDVVIPGAKEKKISAVATVPAAASVSAGGSRAVVMVFVDQTTTIGADPPTTTTSAIRVTLDKVGDRWLISDFTPV